MGSGARRALGMAVAVAVSAWLALGAARGPDAAVGGGDGSAPAIAHSLNAGGESSVAVMAADGARFAILVPSASDPDFSPDGRSLAVAARRDEDSDIALAGIDGGASRQLTFGPAEDVQPVFSPDGRQVAFSRVVRGAEGEMAAAIHVIGIDGSGLKRVTAGRTVDLAPDWSPDGRLIAFTRWTVRRDRLHTHVFLRDLESGAERRLVPGSEPAFSPDGGRIAYVRRDGSAGETCFAECTNSGEIHVVSLDGRGDVRLTRSGADDTSPSWVRGGRQLVFSSDRADPGRQDYELYAMDDRGRCVTRLSNSSAWSGTPDWNPAAGGPAACESSGVAAGARSARIHVDLSPLRRPRAYRVFWLGHRYRGLLLTHAERATGRVDDSFHFIYDDCARIGGGCPDGVQVQNRPLCWWKDEPSRPLVRRIGRLRGAPVYALARRNADRGRLEVHTGGAEVVVFAATRSAAWRALSRLRPLDGAISRLAPPPRRCA